MKWNESTQERFNILRVKKFEGQLTADESAELAALQTQLEQDIDLDLSPVLASLERENAIVRQKVDVKSEDNAALLQIIEQQKQLVADARGWLSEFENRHNAILQTYQQVTGKNLFAQGF